MATQPLCAQTGTRQSPAPLCEQRNSAPLFASSSEFAATKAVTLVDGANAKATYASVCAWAVPTMDSSNAATLATTQARARSFTSVASRRLIAWSCQCERRVSEWPGTCGPDLATAPDRARHLRDSLLIMARKPGAPRQSG
jgi:hypothetical protein